MWVFQDKAALESTSNDVQKVIGWRDDIVPHLNVLKTIMAFKSGCFKLSVNSLVSRAGPMKKEIEECIEF